MDRRPSWDTYFLKLAHVIKERSNCIRMNVGAVIVQGKHIIATGYNGTPAGITNCSEGGCERCQQRQNNELKENERKDLCICAHAEQNAILQSAYNGAPTKGALLYSTVEPCLQCAKAIINAGISRVVYEEEHHGGVGLDLLKKAQVAVTKI